MAETDPGPSGAPDEPSGDSPEPALDEHEAIQAEFSDHWDKTLPPARAQLVDDHLATCARCRGEYDAFVSTLSALGDLGQARAQAPEGFDEQVAGTLHARSGGLLFRRGSGWLGERRWAWIGVAAAVVLLALVVLQRCSATGSVHDTLPRRSPDAPARPLSAPPAE